jgi:purine-binding chemotaxis protein CheW
VTPLPEHGTDFPQYVLLETSGQRFALARECVHSILPMVSLATPPGLPPFTVGVLPLGEGADETPPVLRLDSLLRLPNPARVPTLHSHILLVQTEEKSLRFGLLVERVLNLMRSAPESVLPTDEERSFNGCVQGLLPLPDGETAAVLSVERLLLVEEQERLAAFARVQEERRRAALVPSAFAEEGERQ